MAEYDFTFNPMTNKLDIAGIPESVLQTLFDLRYVKKSGDVMTGKLTIDSNLQVNRDITLRKGQRLYLDGT